MKIGCVTVVDAVPNIGNKLQNYAVEQIFIKRNCKAITFTPEKQNNLVFFKIKLMVKRILRLFHLYKRLTKTRELELIRKIRFMEFDKKWLHISEDLIKGKITSESFDFFSIGSDQVWNPTWYDKTHYQAYMLYFAKPQQKICISPSFGIDKIPDKWTEYFKKGLMTINSIAVREKSGADIVKDLIGKDAQVLIDPTLMLSSDEWKKISSESQTRKQCKKKYILTYFIGERSEENINYINSLAEKNSLEVFDLLDIEKPELYKTTPGEFIDLIENAELVCTDSFHASVFSIIFKRYFLVMKRKDNNKIDMSTRLNSLLELFGLENRFGIPQKGEDVFACDFSKVDDVLSREQNKMDSYIKSIIGD